MFGFDDLKMLEGLSPAVQVTAIIVGGIITVVVILAIFTDYFNKD